jgi:aflatoxin B1 aldehyde reductase
MKVATPRLYLGTMTFGWSQTSSVVDESVAKTMVQKFIAFNQKNNISKHYIDTARIYAGGATEPLVGAAIAHAMEDCTHDDVLLIGTKAHPSQPGGLSAQGIQKQMDASLQAMVVVGGTAVSSSFGEYYLHQPDTEHSLLESLRETHALVKQGKMTHLGMSNYHVSEMKRAFDLCQEYGLTKPTVYQGLYNPLSRSVEKELIPLLRENGCSFVAYNPLAAGLLTGKHKYNTEVQSGRFQNNENYLPRFYTDENFQALAIIQDACDKEGISMVEATFRWLLRHSALGEQDGVLLGASSLEQLEQNLDACKAGMVKDELSYDVLKAFDDAWSITQEKAFPYWRSYSSDMPNGRNLDQGASYSAVKK